MGEQPQPDWWSYPKQCPSGHYWGPGQVIVSWSPCDCPGAMRHPGRGHQCVRCGTAGCTAAWYHPKHGWPLKPAPALEPDLLADPVMAVPPPRAQ